MKKLYLVLLALLSFFIAGCVTHVAKVNDMSDIYHRAMIKGAPKILVADLTDNRTDKKKLGTVGALNITSQTEINTVLTNRIAARLKDEGFNIQKVYIVNVADNKEIIEALNYNNGKVLISGELNNFSIASFDAVLEKARCIVIFYIKIFDKNGKAIFSRKFSASAKNWIGLTGPFGTEKLIEQSINASVDALFGDREFSSALEKIK